MHVLSVLYRVAQKSKLLTQCNSLLFLSHPVYLLIYFIACWPTSGGCYKLMCKDAYQNMESNARFLCDSWTTCMFYNNGVLLMMI